MVGVSERGQERKNEKYVACIESAARRMSPISCKKCFFPGTSQQPSGVFCDSPIDATIVEIKLD